MSIQLFPSISSDELDSKAFQVATSDKDTQNVLKTGQMPDDISLDIKDSTLNEYSGESNYEPYSGIVLDPEDNVFKTVSGMFRDKKEFYEKLTKRGYVVRKVFEKKVFDWIEENAKTTMEAYLMFSTAFSKWKGNNLLNQYYTKLLNDIPQLNREKIKGNPNTRGIDAQEESVLTEDDDKTVNDMMYTKILNQYKDKLDGYDFPTWFDKNKLLKSLIDGKIQASDIDLNNPDFAKDYIKPQFRSTIIADKPAISDDAQPLNVSVNFYDSNNNQVSNTQELIKMPVRFLLGKIPANTKQVSRFLQANPELTIQLHNLINKPIKVNDVIINDAPETAGINDEINTIEIKLADKGSFKTSVRQINDNFIALNKDYKTDNQKLLNKAININQAKADQRKLQNLNALFTTDKKQNFDSDEINDTNLTPYLNNNTYKTGQFKDVLNPSAKTINNQTILNLNNPENILKYGKYSVLKRILMNNNESYDINSIVNDVNEYNDCAKDLVKLVDKNEYRENILKKYNAYNFQDCQDKILAKRKNILNKYTTDEILSGKDYYNDPKHYGSFINNSLRVNNLRIHDASKEAEREKNNTKFNPFFDRYKYSESTRETDYIPQVDDIMPGKHVNYNATASYANQPVDGVITNPGAIPTSGHYMYEQDEHWGWVHSELNQDLFDGTRLKPEVREALLRIAEKFRASLGLSIQPVDIYFTGSSANFNYNDSSDIDLHLVYDFEEIGINAEILIKYFIAKKEVFNNDYEISIKGIPVEVGVENLNEPIVTSAIYSVVKDSWMLEPEYAEQLLPQPDMQQYYQLVQKIEDAIETRDSKQIGKVWDELYTIRRQSLADEGEYGKGNALFKKLRNLGYLDRLKKAYYNSASEELSLESLKEIA